MVTQIVGGDTGITIEILKDVLQKANLCRRPVEWTANDSLTLQPYRKSAEAAYEQWALSEIQAGVFGVGTTGGH